MQSSPTKPFEVVARQFTELVDVFTTSSDPVTRQKLLAKMRLVISEVDALIAQRNKDHNFY